MVQIDALEKLIADGQDSALLRVTLANAYHQADNLSQALVHARQAVSLNPDYSAAYKLLAELLLESSAIDEAADVFARGIECASRMGDQQLQKVMQVLLRRLQK